MKVGQVKISKKEFYLDGGFANPNLFRKQNGNGWGYYRIVS